MPVQSRCQARQARRVDDARPLGGPSQRHIEPAQTARRLGQAYDAAIALAGLDRDELLGMLPYLPPVPDQPRWQQMHRAKPVCRPRFAQVWACLGLLHRKAEEPLDGLGQVADERAGW